MALGFLVGVQLARGLGPASYGQYGIAMAIIGILSIPGQFGLPQLVTREVAAALPSGDAGLIRAIVLWARKFAWAVSAIIALVTMAGAAAYSLASNDPVSQGQVAAALLVGALLIPLQTVTRVMGGALQGLHRIVIGQVPDAIVRPLLTSILLFVLFATIPNASAAHAMGVAVAGAAFSFFAARLLLAAKLPRGEPRRDVGDVRKWIGSAIPLALTNSLRVIEGHIGVLALGFLATAIDAGYFRLALSLAILISFPIILINQSVIPVFARLFAAGEFPKLQRVVTHAARSQFASVALLSIPLFLAAEPLITFLFGAEYAPASRVLVLIAIAQLISTAFGPNGNLLNMTGHERRMNFVVAVSLLTNVAAAAVLIPLLGLTGAAWAWIISTFVWNALAWYFARKLLGINGFILPKLAGGSNLPDHAE